MTPCLFCSPAPADTVTVRIPAAAWRAFRVQARRRSAVTSPRVRSLVPAAWDIWESVFRMRSEVAARKALDQAEVVS